MNEELRCYTFTDFMLSPIQQGIQSGHASMELVNKYMIDEGWKNGYAEIVAEWVKDYKTIICLNGGDFAGVTDWLTFFDEGHQNNIKPYAYAGFTEEASQGGNLTSVAVILPARIFDGASAVRRARYDDKVTVTWDHMLEELRVTWTDNDFDSQQHMETYNKWERDLMNRLNGLQLAR